MSKMGDEVERRLDENKYELLEAARESLIYLETLLDMGVLSGSMVLRLSGICQKLKATLAKIEAIDKPTK